MRRKVFVGIMGVALLVGTALVATVTTASADVRAAKSPLGTPKKATGSLVTLGFVSDGKSDTIDATADINGGAGCRELREQLSRRARRAQDRVERVRDAPDAVGRDRLRHEHGAGQGADRDHARVAVRPERSIDGIKDAGIPFLQYGSLDQGVLAGPAASVFVLTNSIGTALAGPAGDRR